MKGKAFVTYPTKKPTVPGEEEESVQEVILDQFAKENLIAPSEQKALFEVPEQPEKRYAQEEEVYIRRGIEMSEENFWLIKREATNRKMKDWEIWREVVEFYVSEKGLKK